MARISPEEKAKIKEQAQLKKVNAQQASKRRKQKQKTFYEIKKPTGDVEVDSKNDLTELQDSYKKHQDFRERLEKENQRLDITTDSEYWVALCFTTRSQKEDFLRKLNILQFGDKYLDGEKVAQELGIDLESVEMKYQISDKIDKDYQKFVM